MGFLVEKTDFISFFLEQHLSAPSVLTPDIAIREAVLRVDRAGQEQLSDIF